MMMKKTFDIKGYDGYYLLGVIDLELKYLMLQGLRFKWINKSRCYGLKDIWVINHMCYGIHNLDVIIIKGILMGLMVMGIKRL